MTQEILIQLRIIIPDSAQVATPDVDYKQTPPVIAATLRTMDEPPLPDAPPPDMMAEAQRIFNDPDPAVREYQQKAAVVPTLVGAAAPVCAQHGNTMKRWPAGVSKTKKGPNGGPATFNASWRCSANDCPTKPIWDRDAA